MGILILMGDGIHAVALAAIATFILAITACTWVVLWNGGDWLLFGVATKLENDL